MTDANPPPAPKPDRSPRRAARHARKSRWPWIVGLAIVVAGAGVGIWMLISGDDDTPDTAGPGVTEPANAPTTAAPAPPDAEGEELLELLAASRDLTFHATYRAEGDPAEIGGELTLELFRDDGRIRQDSHLESDTGSARTVGIVVDDTAILCNQRDSEEFICSETEASEEQRDGIFGIDLADLAGADVTATDEVIDGRDARCFTYARADGDAEICLTADGIPVRSTAGITTLVLVELEDTVAEDTFEPPTPPVQGDPDASG